MSIWMLANTGSTAALAFLLSAFTEWQSIGFAVVTLLTLCAVATLAIWMRPVGD